MHNRRLEIAAARAMFLEEGTGADEVRPLVAASWQRSRTAGVDALTTVPGYHSDLDTDGHLVSAARPVVDRLADEVSELALSIALTDASSRLLLRVDTETRIGRLLDAVHFAPGFDYGESAVGTNGVGTAFESRQPVTISGPEHFAERLQAFTCTGAPIRDPLSGRVMGVLDLTCLFEDSSPVLRSLVRATTAEIERALLMDHGHEQQAVFDAFTRTAARSSGAVGAVGLSVLLANQTMHGLFSATEYEQLRTHARYLVDDADRAEDDIELGSRTRVRLRAQRVVARGRVVGVVFDAARLPDPAETVASASPVDGAATPGWRRAEAEVSAAIRALAPVVVAGEGTTGKATLVVSAFRRTYPDGIVEVLDSPDQAGRLADELPGRSMPTLALIRRLDRWDAAAGEALGRLAEAAGPPHLLAATFTAARGEGPDPALLRPFVSSALVPPLRHRAQDLPQLADALLRSAGRTRALSPAALRVLAGHDWPGNLAELQDVLLHAANRRPAGAIEAYDLPAALSTRPPRQLGAIESAERDAIVTALQTTGGNRVHAAEQLGISRATLYRKIREFGIAIPA